MRAMFMVPWEQVRRDTGLNLRLPEILTALREDVGAPVCAAAAKSVVEQGPDAVRRYPREGLLPESRDGPGDLFRFPGNSALTTLTASLASYNVNNTISYNQASMSDPTLPNLFNYAPVFSNVPAVVQGPLENTCQMLLNVWTASAYGVEGDPSDVEYYFVVQLNGMFNNAPAYTTDQSQARGYYTRYISIAATITNTGSDPNSPPILVCSSPDTTENAAEATSGVDYSLGGSVGSSGGDSSSGMNISQSKTMPIPDVAITNLSDPAQATYKVAFAFADADWKGMHGADSTVGKPPLAAISTFQPLSYWIWKIPKQYFASLGASTLQMRIDVAIQLKKRMVTDVRRKENYFGPASLVWDDIKINLPPDPNPGQ